MKKHNSNMGLLLAIIYFAFISLGLPDGILGTAWPSIRSDLSLPLELMGILTTLLFACSFISSVVSGHILNKFGTAKVTFISCLMTGIALLGYAVSPNFIWLALFTFPLGLGQGAVDSGLNSFVAENYSSRHMNWVHCFWGFGASIGPLIMTYALTGFGSWRKGYGSISIIQLFLAVLLCISLIKGIWYVKHNTSQNMNQSTNINKLGLSSKTTQFMAITQFFLYTGIEFSMSAWISSVLIESRGVPMKLAGYVVTIYYFSIMIGRIFSGIIVNKLGNMNMIRGGLILAIFGGAIINFSDNIIIMFLGITIFGIGLAPLYPCLMHETPNRFLKEVSRKLIGYQVGAACVGGSIISAGIGVILSNFSLELIFEIIILLLCIYFVINEILNMKFLHMKTKD
ncbi:MFS transporter [Anaerosacchariphilus polymeriproducens]|nr:MFS transporter [Anaerosacchariphilus polymeriproducens]